MVYYWGASSVTKMKLRSYMQAMIPIYPIYNLNPYIWLNPQTTPSIIPSQKGSCLFELGMLGVVVTVRLRMLGGEGYTYRICVIQDVLFLVIQDSAALKMLWLQLLLENRPQAVS